MQSCFNQLPGRKTGGVGKHCNAKILLGMKGWGVAKKSWHQYFCCFVDIVHLSCLALENALEHSRFWWNIDKHLSNKFHKKRQFQFLLHWYEDMSIRILLVRGIVLAECWQFAINSLISLFGHKEASDMAYSWHWKPRSGPKKHIMSCCSCRNRSTVRKS